MNNEVKELKKSIDALTAALSRGPNPAEEVNNLENGADKCGCGHERHNHPHHYGMSCRARVQGGGTWCQCEFFHLDPNAVFQAAFDVMAKSLGGTTSDSWSVTVSKDNPKMKVVTVLVKMP